MAKPTRFYSRSFFQNTAVAVLLSVCPQGARGIQPSGTNIGGIRFDAVIEISPPLAPAHVVLFVRYWVATNFYHLGVVWAEPHGEHLSFPTYPPTLSIGSDEQSFTVEDGLYSDRGVRVSKPIGVRGVFDSMYGDYPIGKIRFAETEARAGRLYNMDFSGFQSLGPGASGMIAMQLWETNAFGPREASRVEASADGEQINWIRMFNADNHLTKRIVYEWDGETQRPRLNQETVFFGQRPIAIGPQSGVVRVKAAKTNYEFKSFPATHEPDGRNCTIDYAPVRLASRTVRLPVEISVRTGDAPAIIRSARMMNFEPFDGDSTQAEHLATEFASFTPAERDYRAFLIKYWQKAPDDVSEKDRVAIEKLRKAFGEPLLPGCTVGERLKRANILIELERLLGNEDGLEESFQLYLDSLSEEGLTEMVLDGGSDRIETSAAWGRQVEADNLLDCWVKAAAKTVPIECALEFAQRQVGQGSWATLKLLDCFRGTSAQSPVTLFRWAALKCLLLKDLRSSMIAGKSLNASAKARAEWAASHINQAEIEQQFSECLGGTRTQFNALQSPSAAEKVLDKQVEAAAKLMPVNKME